MPAERICSECGTPLPEKAPGDRCPKCLLQLGLGESGIDPEAKEPSFEQGDGAIPPTDADSMVERPGTLIGRYRLLRQIGEGGFGIVFMAEQTEPVQRKVALKVIKAGMDSREITT